VVALLRRSGVASVMNTRCARQETRLSRKRAQRLMGDGLDWIIVDREGVDALYVTRPIAPGIDHLYGVLTRARIESAYQYR
jgi:hypothetical protein